MPGLNRGSATPIRPVESEGPPNGRSFVYRAWSHNRSQRNPLGLTFDVTLSWRWGSLKGVSRWILDSCGVLEPPPAVHDHRAGNRPVVSGGPCAKGGATACGNSRYFQPLRPRPDAISVSGRWSPGTAVWLHCARHRALSRSARGPCTAGRWGLCHSCATGDWVFGRNERSCPEPRRPRADSGGTR